MKRVLAVGATVAVVLALTPTSAQAAATTLYVATNGSDSNAGTQASPFATLQRAQQAMENSSIKTTYVEAGTYHITSSIHLTGADSGETWSYYAPDGVNSAVLDGGNTVDIFSVDGSSNLTINGLKMQHVNDFAIFTPSNTRADNVTIENCDIGFNQHTGAIGGFNPLLVLDNVTHAKILNNYVHDGASQGISLMAYNAGDSIDGSVISGNVVVRTVQQMNDGGGIYVAMRNSNVTGGHVTISDNFVSDYGGNGIAHAEGIYLDDDASNVTVSGNVIGPGAPGTGAPMATIINGGSNNTFTDNIVDLGSTGTGLIAGWTEPGGGGALFFNWNGPNVFQGNVIVSNYAGATHTSLSGFNGTEYVQGNGYPTNMGVIGNNVYYNYGGGSVVTSGNLVSDSHPMVVNPQLSGPTYALAANSPVFSSIAGFAPIVGGWGPQGFVLPVSSLPAASTPSA